MSWEQGDTSPFDDVVGSDVAEPLPHWLYVGVGLGDLGFEPTFRLRREASEPEPPGWPVEVLRNLGRYVLGTGNRIKARDWMPLYGPMTWDVPTELTALVFTHDAELAAEMEEGARTEGSGSSAAWLSRLHWSIDDEGELRVVIPLGEVDDVAQAFRRRLPFGRELLVADGQQSVLFQATDAVSIVAGEARVTVGLPPEAVAWLVAALRPLPATLRPSMVPGLTLVLSTDVPY